MKRTSKIALGALGGVVVLLGGVYVASYFIAGNQVPAKAEVAGVSIGGLTPAEATEKLRTELSEQSEEPFGVRSGETVLSLVPADAGLSVNYEATVAAAGGGFSWNPVDIFRALSGGGQVDLVREVDEAKLTTALTEHAGGFAAEPADAAVSFDQGKVVRTPSVTGTTLIVDQTAQSVTKAFEEGKGEAQAVVDEKQPSVTDAMADEVTTTFADPLVSGPVTLTHNDTSMEISPAALGDAAKIELKDGKLVGSLDADKLLTSTAEAQKSLKLNVAKDASFTFTNGAVTVVPAVVGEEITKDSFVNAVHKAATATGEGRTAAVEVATKDPEFSTEDAKSLGTFTKIGSFTTNFPYAAYRNTNLGRAAELVNGTVLMPDDIFSLNDALGERTTANGFTDGYVINSGRLVRESGGGISQAATTLYNAGFFAGYKDVEHKPHSLYFDRYPAGREATIYYGQLDMRFQNDTKYPAIIKGTLSPASSGKRGSLTFEIWSKPTYEKVESTDIVKSDYYSGSTRTVKGDASCEAQAPIQGFTASWKRLFYQDGKVVKEEPYSWKYNAGDRIVCE